MAETVSVFVSYQQVYLEYFLLKNLKHRTIAGREMPAGE